MCVLTVGSNGSYWRCLIWKYFRLLTVLFTTNRTSVITILFSGTSSSFCFLDTEFPVWPLFSSLPFLPDTNTHTQLRREWFPEMNGFLIPAVSKRSLLTVYNVVLIFFCYFRYCNLLSSFPFPTGWARVEPSLWIFAGVNSWDGHYREDNAKM